MGQGQKTISTARMETFSDAVLAIIITIMVLELKVPYGSAARDLFIEWPVFLSYVLSFMKLAIYWMNHHKVMQWATHADNTVLWTNNLMLFWASLVPFATAYMGENNFAAFPTALYACVLLCVSTAYLALLTAIARHHRREPEYTKLSHAARRKNCVAIAVYAISIPIAFWHPLLTVVLAFAVAGLYFIPEMWVEEGARICGLKAGA